MLGATSNKLETNLRLTPQTFLYKPKGASHVSNVRGVCYWFVKFVILTPLTCYKTSNILTSPKVMLVGDVIVTLTYTPNIPKECQGCLLEGFSGCQMSGPVRSVIVVQIFFLIFIWVLDIRDYKIFTLIKYKL